MRFNRSLLFHFVCVAVLISTGPAEAIIVGPLRIAPIREVGNIFIQNGVPMVLAAPGVARPPVPVQVVNSPYYYQNAQRVVLLPPGARVLAQSPLGAMPVAQASPPPPQFPTMPSMGGGMGGGMPPQPVLSREISSNEPFTPTAPLSPVITQRSSNPPPTVTTPEPILAGTCGTGEAGTDMWSSVMNVVSRGVIPENQGANLKSSNFPTLRRSGDQMVVDFGSGGDKSSECSSATATAFYMHIADLVKTNQLTLSPEELAYLNSGSVHNALNGNTYSVGLLYQDLGGQSMLGSASGSPSLIDVLRQAHRGDVLKFDRKNGFGHSTIFEGLKGNDVCYWSSNKNTHGVGENCEPIDTLVDAAVSRFPSDVGAIPARLDEMRHSQVVQQDFSSVFFNKSKVKWASSLDCGNSSPLVRQLAGVKPGDAKQ